MSSFPTCFKIAIIWSLMIWYFHRQFMYTYIKLYANFSLTKLFYFNTSSWSFFPVCTQSTHDFNRELLWISYLCISEPPMLIEGPESTVTVSVAVTVRFTCIFAGWPTPTITWLKSGRQIKHNGRIKVHHCLLQTGGNITTISNTFAVTSFSNI